MKITVIGCGRWGSLITWYLDKTGHEVTLYGRATSAHMQRFIAERRNNLLELPESVHLSTDLNCTLDAQVIVISVPSQGLQGLMDQLKGLNLRDKIFVLCMKGIEIETGRRLSQVARDNIDTSCAVAVWLGPGHVQEFHAGIPNCMVIDSDNEQVKHMLVDRFSSNLIRFYYGEDLIGNEIGAAAKNVIGIAAGALDGLQLTTLKGALMSRGTREIARLIEAMGGNPFSAYGLCHLGDYEATVFSPYSHNRRFGEMLVRGEKFDKLAEGYYTADALMRLGRKHNVELPICEAVYKVLYEGSDPRETIESLFTRALKTEFWKE
ncbi:MAG: NAD(P)H-dependent glycerol-3-phosphate dehydrogenase [Clostridia bacterium]|nr:NAD(P)H-dependent glycerol-3-phosphate dehydrogenase [Clostridia bacterium]MBP3652842.1 NAD(P)H-dependent glycerol-3-phosphate dehydrogenase [Clostridia bacterium]